MEDNNEDKIITKELFIEILSRDDEETENVHLNDYNIIIKSLSLYNDITIIKLACQAIDKSCSRNQAWVIPSASALSNLLAGTSDRSVKISCAQALNRLCKLSNLENSSISTLVTLLQIAIACNVADRLLIRPLQEGLDIIKRPEDNIIVATDNDKNTTTNTTPNNTNTNTNDNTSNPVTPTTSSNNSNSNNNHKNNDNNTNNTPSNNTNNSTTKSSNSGENNNNSSSNNNNSNKTSTSQPIESGSLPKRGFSFDLPSDGSMKITEDQLKALGSIREHLWKSLRFKLQRFFVANVTTPQKLELHTFLIHSQVQGLMRLSGFSCHAETDYFTKYHWERLVDTIDRIYDGREPRLDHYSIDAPRNRRNDHSSAQPPSSSSSSSSSYPNSSSNTSSSTTTTTTSSSTANNNHNDHNDRQTPNPETVNESGAPSYPKYLILQGIPSSYSDALDIYDYLKNNHILFGVEKRDIGISLPSNPKTDYTAYVRFPSHEDAVTAYNKITNTPYHGNKLLYVDYSMTAPTRVLFMYKIIRYVTKESISDSLKIFCKLGSVEKVDLPMNSSFGYVTFSEIDDAIRVYRSLLKSSEGGLWVPVADSSCGEQVLVFFKYSKYPDPPRASVEHGFKKPDSRHSKTPKNYIIVRVKNLHEHDLTDLESICKKSGECIRLNSLKGSAVYQFTFEEHAAAAMTSIKQNLQHCQVQLLDLVEYRHGRVDDFQENATGGYDPKKQRSHDDRGYNDNRSGRPRSSSRRDDYPPRSSYRDRSRDRDRDYDYDRDRGNGRDRDRDRGNYYNGSSNNNNNTKNNNNEKNNSNNNNNNSNNNNKEKERENEKNGDRNREKDQQSEKAKERKDNSQENNSEKHGNEKKVDDVEVDYDYDQDKSGENDNTPRVDRNNSWLSKDQDEPEDEDSEQHHRRSRWNDIIVSKDEDDSDRETKKQSEENDDEARKRGRSPSIDQEDNDFKKSRGFDERAWQRESNQQSFKGRGRGRGRGRGSR